MARTAEQTRRRIIDAAYGLFYRKGFLRVGVDAIAETAGVTKRTLYDHFTSKDELLRAVLEFHRQLALIRIENWGTRLSGDIDDMLDSLFSELAQWAAKPRWAGAGFTRLTMELADLPGHPARAIARRHKAEVEAWLARELARRGLDAPGARAREIAILLEGSTALMLVHGDRSIAAAAADAAKQLVRNATAGKKRAVGRSMGRKKLSRPRSRRGTLSSAA
ncbi:MAG TPA: helix-turn-helix domain-containing protein [Xanthobacteraceae bacterium]|nr:helix-turn-helix domain-containing protein [Xanthobacteraceae bacterium]